MILIKKTSYKDVAKNESYGWIFRSAARTAGERLSYDAYKVYIDLSLNQNNYHCKDSIPESVVDELYKWGYVTFAGGELTFNEWGVDAISQPQTTTPVVNRPMYQPPVQDNDMYVYVGSPEPVEEEPEYVNYDLPW